MENILILSNGNPGVSNVLLEILKINPVFLNHLSIALQLTNSNTSYLWVIYKNVCNKDINKTMKTLSEWFDNSTETLEDWLNLKYL